MSEIDKKHYDWLDALKAPLPRMVMEARALHGVAEDLGAANDPQIMAWATEIGGDVKAFYTGDSIPWCGLFMAYVAKRAGKTPPKDPLWALNWAKFGEPAGQPALGDVLVFTREGGGHVALYVAEDPTTYHVLGGNHSDRVCYKRIKKDRMKAARRPLYMAQPPAVRPYVVNIAGAISTNEE